jgi:hypothetical protein
VTVEQLRQLRHAQPFQPFTMHLADGRQIPVRHPELVATSPSGRTIIVCQPDDSFNIVDLLLVTGLEVNPAATGPG